MKDISEKTKQMTKIYELWKETYTGDWFTYEKGAVEKTLIATYDLGSKSFAKKEAEKLNEKLRKDDDWRPHFYLRVKLVESNYVPNVTEVNYYPTFQDALEKLMVKDADNIFIRHELNENEGVENHKHKNYNEWVIFNHGKLEIMVNSRSQVVDNTDIPECCSVFFPKNKNHAVTSLSKTKYYVLRGK
ncbi:MAG: hypothetical protein ABIH28_02160 [archaeon]